MSTFLLPLPIALMTGCTKTDDAPADSGMHHTDSAEPGDSDPVEEVDADGDGSPEGEDCDDANADVFPGADEVCNGIDDDCDDVVDDDAIDQGTWYGDNDGDGYGAPDQPVTACDQPSDTVDNDLDCDDDDADRYPSAPEICGDGVVQDCDGTEADALAACPPSWPDQVDDVAAIRWSDDNGHSYSYSGRSIAVGDTDGDGVDDVLVGAWNRNNGDESTGTAYLMLGGGVSSGELDDVADATFKSDWDWQSCGYTVATIPDTDGDGDDELLMQCRDSEAGGRIYQFLGGSTGESVAQDDAVGDAYPSYGTDYSFGAAMAGGDLDGDGVGDLIVGAPSWRTEGASFGAVLVYLGGLSGSETPWTADATAFSVTANDAMGSGAAIVGDVDGDGLDDVLLGATGQSVDEGCSYCGAAWLVTAGDVDASTFDVESAHTARISGTADYDYVGGSALAGAGDVNGDGYADMILGAPQADGGAETDGGEAYVFLGGVSGQVTTGDADATIVGSVERGWLGRDVASAGDVDQDGLDDVLVGAPVDFESEASTGGTAYVFLASGLSGSLTPEDALESTQGEAPDDGLGSQVASGDVDGDGLPDAVLSAPYWDIDEASSAGATYVLLNDGGY